MNHEGFKIVAILPTVDVAGDAPPGKFLFLLPACVAHLWTWEELEALHQEKYGRMLENEHVQ